MKKLFALLTFVTVFAACTSTSKTEPTVTTDSLTTETVDTAAGTALSVIVDSTATDTVAVK